MGKYRMQWKHCRGSETGCRQARTNTPKECSAEKSELLLLRPPDYREMKYPPTPTITTKIGGPEVPAVQHVRDLGLQVQTGRSNTVVLERLTAAVIQGAQVVARISPRKRGMGQTEFLRLIDLGLPRKPTAMHLLNLEIHNTVDELWSKLNEPPKSNAAVRPEDGYSNAPASPRHRTDQT
ncbi:hypothetical protein HPB50_025681 [Hyalomma asiaticum]|uniref:Uncharacterized protein n=1 Tax=Hyalomma asiaticum TaxID=266040 RepID=A0ACB7T763_HYAAI|nr:hypothetical protein HPB50_025681 [Hyalomma asiaticum]